ncbi:hypothetical protein D3C81_1171810 [compost metagenome]
MVGHAEQGDDQPFTDQRHAQAGAEHHRGSQAQGQWRDFVDAFFLLQQAFHQRRGHRFRDDQQQLGGGAGHGVVTQCGAAEQGADEQVVGAQDHLLEQQVRMAAGAEAQQFVLAGAVPLQGQRLIALEPQPTDQHHQADACQPTDQCRFQCRALPHPEQGEEQQQRRQRFDQAQGIEGDHAARGVVQGQQTAFEHRQRHRQQQQPGEQAQLRGDVQFTAELTGQGHHQQGQQRRQQATEHQHLAEQQAHRSLLGRLITHRRIQAAAGGGADQVGQGAEQGKQAAFARPENPRQQHVAQQAQGDHRQLGAHAQGQVLEVVAAAHGRAPR